MDETYMVVVIIALFAALLIPHLISYTVICGLLSEDNDYHRKKLLLISPAVNILVLIAVIKIMVGGSIFNYAARFVSRNLYYNDIKVLSAAVLICSVLSVFVPIVILIICERGTENISLKKRSVGMIALLFSFALIPSIFGFSAGSKENACLEITGICRKTNIVAENKLTGESEDETQSKYLIANNGILTVKFEKLWLSENIDDLCNAEISDLTLAPGETYEVTLSEDKRLNIKKDGGTVVYLSDDSGKVLSDVTVPALGAEEWYMLIDGKWQIVQTEKEESFTVSTPDFSVPGGFYENEFELNITSEEGLTVYYTLDSSIPTTDSPVCNGAIRIYNKSSEPNVYRAIPNVTPDYLTNDPTPKEPVDKATVVRAICVDAEGNVSDVVTETYFVGLDQYKTADVISLVSEPNGLFDEETGIYVNGPEYESYYRSLTPEEQSRITSDHFFDYNLNYRQQGEQ